MFHRFSSPFQQVAARFINWVAIKSLTLFPALRRSYDDKFKEFLQMSNCQVIAKLKTIKYNEWQEIFHSACLKKKGDLGVKKT